MSVNITLKLIKTILLDAEFDFMNSTTVSRSNNKHVSFNIVKKSIKTNCLINKTDYPSNKIYNNPRFQRRIWSQ